MRFYLAKFLMRECFMISKLDLFHIVKLEGEC